MTIQTTFKKASLFSASALVLAVASASHAYEFEVGDVTVNYGGYTKLDMIYNVEEDLGDAFNIGSINTGAAEDNEVEGSTRFHARQTRFGFGTDAMVSGSNLKTYVEADFFSGNADSGFNQVVSNSTQLRLRHGFGSWNGILAGQTWSNFMPLVALPPTLDFNGPAGYIFNRQAQLRYTTGGLSVALENPESTVNNSLDDNDPLPDLTMKYKGAAGPLNYSLSGVVTYLEVDDGNTDASENGYGVMLAASTTVGGVKLGGNFGYNDGANRYIFNSVSPFQNGYLDANGDIETVSQVDAMGFVDMPLTPMLNGLVAVGYSGGDADDEAAAQASGFRDSTMSVHANLRYKPAERIMYGLEYQYAAVDEYDGTDGDASRVQASVKYTF
ncbi:DcaP family trimeric outer membrane transporter [Halomonas llamarensis]|uniref:DcaP family trimeric outer membrane transporter n=1 Tax=Halomonas llamarensis TaxID=2945104 RepID=A0ABT0SPK2_9GAMM|nr:DcaP family trimeric outer membrane transporter [Halomonas llamarensis]